MPGLIAMTSVFVVVGIEMVFASRGAGHVHAADYESLRLHDQGAHPRPPHKRNHSYGRYNNGSSATDGHVRDVLQHDLGSADNLMAERSFSLASPVTPAVSRGKGRVARDSLDSDHDSDLDID
jgi:zinc transporter 1/2/3